MREIKFRAWDKQGKRFLGMDDWYLHPNKGSCLYWNKMPIKPEDLEILQFTGLKDKNAKEVYEGDILLCGDDGENFSQKYDEENDEYVNTHKAKVIGPTDSYPAFEIDPNPCDDVNGLSQLVATGEFEVIGNIYENPELLKDKP